MPHRPDAPDVVIPCRAGENRELRYALRSLEKHFDYRHIWIVGSWPRWLNRAHEHLTTIKRPTLSPKYKTTRAHYRWACQSPEVSDPWVMWNDDFYCLRRTRELRPIHRGKNSDVLKGFASWTSKWAIGLRETDQLMRRIMPRRTLYNYDLHTPLLIHKAQMLQALDLADAMKIHAPQVRTLYGNIARLGGSPMADPKLYRPDTHTAQTGWLSSEERTFRTAVEAQLNAAGLQAPSKFEIPGVVDRGPYAATPAAANPQAPARRRMRYRVLQTPDGNKVVRQPPATRRSDRDQRKATLAEHVNTFRKGKVGCLSCGH